jgi:cytochrome c oxidase cbb3-type subunit IV
MYRQFYEGMDLAVLPLFALVLFVAVFVGVFIRTYVLRRAGDFDNLARMPLDEGDRPTATGPEDGHE